MIIYSGPQITTKIANKQYGDRQMRERDRDRDEISQMVTNRPKTQTQT